MRRPLIENLAPYGIQAAVASLIFMAGFGPFRFLRGVPTSASGDSMIHVTVAKAMIEQGWYWHVDRLSAPFSLPLVAFPADGLFDTFIMRGLAIFTHDPFALITWFFGLAFVLSALTSAYVLHDLGQGWPTSLAFGLMFAFAPFPFSRSVAHLMLVMYLVPFAVGFAVQLLRGTFGDLPRRRKIIYYLGGAALGLNYIYMAFFGCIFVALATLAQLFRPREVSLFRYGALFLGILVTCTVLAYAPAVIATVGDPAARDNMYGQKTLAEADIHGLKIKHLLLPSASSSIPFVRNIYTQLTAPFPLEYENVLARLGIVGAVGFLVLLLAGFLRLSASPAGVDPLVVRLGPFAALTVAGIFVATIGGLGSMFNVFVSPDIRAYNRISPFLLFMGVAASAALFSFAVSDMSRRAQTLWLLVVLGLALAEQTEFPRIRAVSLAETAKVAAMRPVVERLEKALPKGASVYEMPYRDFPYGWPIHHMHPTEHMMPYVLSRDLRWSWPALSGQAIGLNQRLDKMPPAALAEALATLGFTAVWINRAGYTDDGVAVLGEFTKAGLDTIEDTNGIVVLDLRRVSSRLQSQQSAGALESERLKLLGVDPRAIPKPQ